MLTLFTVGMRNLFIALSVEGAYSADLENNATYRQAVNGVGQADTIPTSFIL